MGEQKYKAKRQEIWCAVFAARQEKPRQKGCAVFVMPLPTLLQICTPLLFFCSSLN